MFILLQDKSWGYMKQIIAWEKKLLQAEETEEAWLIRSQVESTFGHNQDFVEKLLAAAVADNRSRPHPQVPGETQYKIITKDIEAFRVISKLHAEHQMQ